MRVQSQFIEMFGNTSKEMLGKFIQVIRGVSYKPSDVKTADDPDTAVILRSNNINDANLNTDEVVYIDKNRVSGDQYLRINDIVVCASNGSKALVGKAAINKTLTNQYAHGAFCLLVRPNDNINPVYLNTFFQTSLYKKQIDELAAGSNILNIKQEHLTNMILPLPIIEEQNKFAIIAEQADKSKFVGFKSQFIEMFNQDKKVSINEMVDTVWGTSPSSETYNEERIGMPFYQGKAEFGDVYINDAIVYCSRPIKIANKNEILMSVRAPVGAVNIAKEQCCIGRGLAAITPKIGIAEELFIFHALRIIEDDIDRLSTGSTFKAINKDGYNKITLPMAMIDKQRRFVAIAEQADKSKYYN